MNFSESVDVYCERLDASLLSEPLNLITNLAFLGVAAILWHRVKNQNPTYIRPGSRLLIALIFAIGVGSSLFHSVATQWARLADVIPIGVFLFTFLFCFMRWEVGVSNLGAFTGLAMFGLLTLLTASLADKNLSNGSELYFGTWVTLFGMGCFVVGKRAQTGKRWLSLGAATAFSLGLFFRTIDMRYCESWPYGTHFGWHLITGITLYLVTSSYISGPEEHIPLKI